MVKQGGGLDAFYRPREGEEHPGCKGRTVASGGALLRLRFGVEVRHQEGKWVGEEEYAVALGFIACQKERGWLTMAAADQNRVPATAASLGGRRRSGVLVWAKRPNCSTDLVWGETKKTGWAG
jgi:hypothetical protein